MPVRTPLTLPILLGFTLFTLFFAPDVVLPRPTIFTYLTTTPDDDPESIRAAVLPAVIAIHAHSRPLSSLPPPKKLPNPIRRALANGFLALTPTLHDAIDTWEQDNDPLPLINATLDTLALPAHILGPTMQRFPNNTPYTIDTPDDGPPVLPDPASLETLANLPPRKEREPPPSIAPNAGPNLAEQASTTSLPTSATSPKHAARTRMTSRT